MANVDGTTVFVGAPLEVAGKTLNGYAEDASEIVHAIEAELEPLRADWNQSVAAEYFESMWEEFQLSAVGLFGPDGVLGVIAAHMNVAWINYFNAETANVEGWRR